MSRRNNRAKRHPNRHYARKNRKKPKQQAATQSALTTQYPSAARNRAPLCKHWRENFTLQDGLSVLASAYTDRPWPSDPIPEGPAPDYGLYFDELWANDRLFTTPGFRPPFLGPRRRRTDSWHAREVCVYPMTDGSDPDNLREFCRAGEWVLDSLRQGKTVDVGCIGGHGRTGTMLATILVLQGVSGREAVERVWDSYCREAIETQRQVNFVLRVANIRAGRPVNQGLVRETPTKRAPQRDSFTSEPSLAGTSFTEAQHYGTEAEVLAYAHYLENRMTEEPLSFLQWQSLNDQSFPTLPGGGDADMLCTFPPCVNPEACDPVEGDCFAARMAAARQTPTADESLMAGVEAIMQKFGYDEIEWEEIE